MHDQTALKIKGFIIVPAYNEEAGIETFLRSMFLLLETFNKNHSQAFEFTVVVVNDGSIDKTGEILENLSRSSLVTSDVRLDYIHFVKNFGHQAAVIAGLLRAAPQSDFAISLDADGEHPIPLIPTLIETWLKTRTIVHTKRKSCAELGWFKRVSSSLYYKLISVGSGINIDSGMSDFKLWDSEILRQTQNFLPNCGSTRIFAMWLAPHAPALVYEQGFVDGRVSRFTLRKMIRFGLGGLVRYSDLPLRFSVLFGSLVLVASLLFTGHAIYGYLMGKTIPGWASLMLLIGFFGGVNSLLIGLLSEYLLQLSFRSSFPRYVSIKRKDIIS